MITITQTTKATLTITNTPKSSAGTWAEHTETWEEAGPGGNTWSQPGTVLSRETKNNVTITNQTKT